TSDGTPKIADFGLAKMLDSDSGQTRDNSVLGTYRYMAPEVAAGKTKQSDELVDVYGLGAVLYEVLTGEPPFKGKTEREVRPLEADIDLAEDPHLCPPMIPTPPRAARTWKSSNPSLWAGFPMTIWKRSPTTLPFANAARRLCRLLRTEPTRSCPNYAAKS